MTLTCHIPYRVTPSRSLVLVEISILGCGASEVLRHALLEEQLRFDWSLDIVVKIIQKKIERVRKRIGSEIFIKIEMNSKIEDYNSIFINLEQLNQSLKFQTVVICNTRVTHIQIVFVEIDVTMGVDQTMRTAKWTRLRVVNVTDFKGATFVM